MGQAKSIPASHRLAWLNATALLIASWLVIAALSLQVHAGAEPVAVVFPPWWSTEQVFLGAASAKAEIIRMTAVPTVLVLRPASDDGLSRLHQAGAWLIVDPQAVAACFKTNDLGVGSDRRKQ